MFKAAEIVTRQLHSNNSRDFQLLKDVIFVTGPGEEIVVPTGFITDHATIPRILWSWLPPYGRWSPAAVVHDYLCQMHATDQAHPAAPTRADCDRVFLEALRELDVKKFDRRIMWAAVRLASFLFRWGGRARIAEKLDSRSAEVEHA